MSALNTFIQEIENRKKKEISILNNHLSETKSKILKTKEDTNKELEEKYSNEAKIKSQRESARINESARLKAKKIIYDAINENMNSTFEIIKNELKNYVNGPDYSTTLKKMLNYAKKQLGDTIVIHCRSEDLPLVKDMKANVGSSIITMGGILFSDKRGKKEIDMTFEELLRNREDDIKGYLLKKMVNL